MAEPDPTIPPTFAPKDSKDGPASKRQKMADQVAHVKGKTKGGKGEDTGPKSKGKGKKEIKVRRRNRWNRCNPQLCIQRL